MKKIILTFVITVLLNGYFAFSQPRTLNGSNFQGATLPLTTPAGISQLQVQGRLFTQNSQNVPAGTQITGSFANNARWNSMGNLPAGTQVLNGFRTQTDGRALAWGHSVPNAGTVSNGFIEWIGNGAGVASGSLEFRYAVSPTSATPIKLFQMDPPPPFPGIPAFAYATKNTLVGQLDNGTVGSFGVNDIWSATGKVNTANLETYGARQQYNARTLITGIVKSSITGDIKPVIDFGSDGSTIGSTAFQFRTFSNPNDPASITNIFGSSNKFKNMVVAEREYFALNSSQFKFSVFDGGTSVDASTLAVNFVERHNNYNVTDGIRIVNGAETRYNSVAAVTGDVSNSAAGVSYGILGIADGSYTGPGGFADNPWAGYFIGRVGYTGNLVFVSDKKFKKEINDETSIMDKIKQLSPKNYLFDTDKHKSMAFSGKLQHGFISEELEKVFPELVEEAYAPGTSANPKTNGKSEVYKGVNYVGLIPVLTKAIQEQQAEIDALKKQVASLQNTETFVVNKATTPAEKEILDNKAFMLAQNVPNPFTQNTVIKYSLPNATDRAVIVIFNLNGSLIQQFNLPMAKGSNQITVNGGSLAAGKYIYSLLVNGEEVISKTMVLTK